uniref:Putative secreted protein n=1 Tax=Anopheles marajoara TaxID=58244 RepID=A0A2M4CBL1_9DIPT
MASVQWLMLSSALSNLPLCRLCVCRFGVDIRCCGDYFRTSSFRRGYCGGQPARHGPRHCTADSARSRLTHLALKEASLDFVSLFTH